jgi:hypothetical protein
MSIGESAQTLEMEWKLKRGLGEVEAKKSHM